MPDPRLRTILECQFTDIETNADAWNLPSSEFEMPELRDPSVEPPSTPSSPYDCHSPSPLTRAVMEGDVHTTKAFATSPSPCGPQCNIQGAGCKRYPPEYSLHHWRRWSVPHVRKEVIVNLEEVPSSPEEFTAAPILAPTTYTPLLEVQDSSTLLLGNNPALGSTAEEINTPDTTIETAAARETRLRTAWAQTMILSGPDDIEQLYAGAWERREKWLPLL